MNKTSLYFCHYAMKKRGMSMQFSENERNCINKGKNRVNLKENAMVKEQKYR